MARLPLFPKLFLTFLVLILPLVTLSMIVNVRSERLVRDQITSAAQDKLRDYLHSLEGDFGTLVTLMQQYVLDDDFNNLAYSSVILTDEQFTFMVKSVQRKLLILKNMSPYVRDAFVNLPALDRKISAVSYNELPPEEAAALNTMVDLYESPFTRYDGRLWLSLPVPNSNPVGRGFTIALELSNEALLASLGSLTVSGDGGALLHDGELGWLLASGDMPSPREQTLAFLQSGASDGEPALYAEGKERYYAFHQTSPVLGLSLAMFLEEKSLIGPLRQYAAWLWSLSIAAVALVLLFSYRLYRMIHTPMKRLVGAFRSLESGNLNQQLKAETGDEFNYLYHQFNRTVNRLRELIDEVYVQRYQVKAAELKQLQSQINPHFLYNSFFNLYRLAKLRDNDKVIAFSWHLGDYYKYVTKNADQVELEQEVAFCRSYAAIQSIRFGDHIVIQFGDIPEPLRRLTVPKLFLQPLIENAYHHGLEDRADKGLIDITFSRRETCAIITVEDNGESLDEAAIQQIRSLLEEPERPVDSEGLRNVLQRIRLHYGEQASLTADRSPLGGLRITMTIPIKEASV
ncbi:sensor histidine kinase [Paenibacillus daejeonensis]|uniref:sensor histidine kinase n=1 Tax=Paenibacillus daejeonensis TaxID=135193 RepID=UPI000363F654|nr:sensor histidine kinase [Paenibacillus daejeonensis]